MNRYTALFFIVFSFQNLTAQVELSGVINQYTSVTAIENDSCLSRVTVADVSTFEVGNTVVLIQMQGALIVESNSSAFGDIADLKSTGLYEVQQIKSINGQDIFFEKQFVNNYNLEGKVQLISMPVYQDAEVINTLTADAWNGETGGVLALQVDGTLELNADIDVSNLGFRGGQPQTASNNNCTWLFQQSDYFYEFGNWRGAAKGEGITSTIVGKEFGKGPQANGGGGGNDHNSGGGGGGNITFGGVGGRNNEPTTFGCKGNHPGEGGIGIDNSEGRLFFGGGGGAGHDNNGAATRGGNGGGIVILFTNSLSSNGFSIISTGEDAPDSSGDGAGGGGAAGSILLDIQSLSNLANINIEGGDGGTVDNIPDRCHGPGGGGSGGILQVTLTPNAFLDFQLSGGLEGLSINSNLCTDSANDAESGDEGIVSVINYVAIADVDFAIPIADFSYAINGQQVTFSNQSQNSNTSTWTFGDGNSDNSTDPTYTYNQGGIYEVQLVVTNDCGSDTITQTVETVAPPVAGIGTENFPQGCAPLIVDFAEMAIGIVDSFLWTFEGGTPATSTESNPIIVYEMPGIYDVTLEVFGPGGSNSVTEEEMVVVSFPTIADFDYTINESIVTFQNLSSNTTEIIWDFGDGTPLSNIPNPTHQYDTAGIYVVTLHAISEFCDSIISQTIVLDFTNVEDLEKLGLSVFPNPANDWLTIENKSNEITRLKIYGMDGKEIPKLNREFSQNINLDIRDLPSGVYILNLFQGEKLGRFRLVKM